MFGKFRAEGMGGGMPPRDAGGFGGGAFSSAAGGPTTSRFDSGHDYDESKKFFGFSSPLGGMRGSSGQRGSWPFDDMPNDNKFRSFGGGASISMRLSNLQKQGSIEQKLPCSLEELYSGASKLMRISRKVFDANRKAASIEETLTVDIKPGWKKEMRITFAGKGNELPGTRPGDLVFIIDEKPHSVFMRDGNDLVATLKISLIDALTGYTARVTTLDGRNLSIPITNVIHPSYEEVVRGEGMPLPNDPSTKGDLRLKFDIFFPPRLASQNTAVKDLFCP